LSLGNLPKKTVQYSQKGNWGTITAGEELKGDFFIIALTHKGEKNKAVKRQNMSKSGQIRALTHFVKSERSMSRMGASRGPGKNR
jgi:hypothetical protein